jgi:hypothetical protein
MSWVVVLQEKRHQELYIVLVMPKQGIILMFVEDIRVNLQGAWPRNSPKEKL